MKKKIPNKSEEPEEMDYVVMNGENTNSLTSISVSQ